jgi:hypothetical protein
MKAIIDEIVIISRMMFSLLAMWSAVLEYLLLEDMGWRTFVLMMSLPVFNVHLNIVILHCYIQKGTNSEPKEQREEPQKGHRCIY